MLQLSKMVGLVQKDGRVFVKAAEELCKRALNKTKRTRWHSAGTEMMNGMGKASRKREEEEHNEGEG